MKNSLIFSVPGLSLLVRMKATLNRGLTWLHTEVKPFQLHCPVARTAEGSYTGWWGQHNPHVCRESALHGGLFPSPGRVAHRRPLGTSGTLSLSHFLCGLHRAQLHPRSCGSRTGFPRPPLVPEHAHALQTVSWATVRFTSFLSVSEITIFYCLMANVL